MGYAIGHSQPRPSGSVDTMRAPGVDHDTAVADRCSGRAEMSRPRENEKVGRTWCERVATERYVGRIMWWSVPWKRCWVASMAGWRADGLPRIQGGRRCAGQIGESGLCTQPENGTPGPPSGGSGSESSLSPGTWESTLFQQRRRGSEQPSTSASPKRGRSAQTHVLQEVRLHGQRSFLVAWATHSRAIRFKTFRWPVLGRQDTWPVPSP